MAIAGKYRHVGATTSSNIKIKNVCTTGRAGNVHYIHASTLYCYYYNYSSNTVDSE